MAEDSTKTYVFGSDKSCTDPASLLAMMNNGGFGNNMSWIWVIFLFFLYGWRGNSFLGNGANGLGGEIGRNFDTTTLLNAISGNGNAISNLATLLNCSVGLIKNAVDSVNASVANVGNQIGMSGMLVINAIQSGNQTLASQLATCCCENKQLVLTQGYENQIANLNQTNTIGSKIDGASNSIAAQIAALTTFLSDKFCDLEKREMQNKIDSLREKNSTLQGVIDNANQTSQILGYISSLVTPLSAEVASIKCRLPETVNVPYSPVTPVPSCVAFQYGMNGFNNGLWA